MNNHLIYFIFITAVLLSGCKKEEIKKDYVARVNDSYLMKDDLINGNDSLMRYDQVKKWIDNELFYQQALNDGVIKDDEFVKILDKTKRELAISFWIKNYLEENQISPSNEELNLFYESNLNTFKLLHPAFIINNVIFNNENRAIAFRNTVMESNWNRSLNSFINDTTLISQYGSNLVYKYELGSGKILRIVESLQPGEISLVINLENGNFSVINLIQKYQENEIPKFEEVTSLVERRMKADAMNKILKTKLEELYTNNEIEIKK